MNSRGLYAVQCSAVHLQAAKISKCISKCTALGGGEIEELRGGGVASLVPAGSRAQLSGQGHAQE